MTRTRENGESVMAEINITPFTDVLLVLLIIFMILASLAIPPGFERTFHRPNSGAHRMSFSHAVPVVITRDGRIRFNGVAVTQTGLYAAMNKLEAKERHARIALYADAHAPYGLAIRVLDAAKVAGITDVSFVTE